MPLCKRFKKTFSLVEHFSGAFLAIPQRIPWLKINSHKTKWQSFFKLSMMRSICFVVSFLYNWLHFCSLTNDEIIYRGINPNWDTPKSLPFSEESALMVIWHWIELWSTLSIILTWRLLKLNLQWKCFSIMSRSYK